MNSRERNATLWQDTLIPHYSSLSSDQYADVCVVGGGIAGLSVAYQLARQGASVVILEHGMVGSGQTHRTTAHLTNAIDNRYFHLENLFGREKVKLAAQSHTAAIDEVENTVKRENIDCDFLRVPGYLFLGPDENEKYLQKEATAAHNAGLKNVKLVTHTPKIHPLMLDLGPALHFPNQAQFHPMKYLLGLAFAINKMGGKIFHGTHVVGVKAHSSTVAKVWTRTQNTVHAGAVVVATNAPINDRVVIHTKQAAYRSYVLVFEIPKDSAHSHIHPHIHPMLLWDTSTPYHYVRIQRGAKNDYLLVGGEDHRTGQNDDYKAPFTRLEIWSRQRFPFTGKIAYQWSGQVLEPVDAMAFIGRNPADSANIYVATGDSGQGMTHGTIAGLLIRDLILKRPNPWESLYSPARKNILSLPHFISENINTQAQYAKWLSHDAVQSIREIPAGSGAVISKGMKKTAVYRDTQGTVHKFSAVCKHLGAILCWNSAERTWDCPAHGSRYDCMGRVIEGPAFEDLTPEGHKPKKVKEPRASR